jgi:hypothetical protein
MKIKGYEVVGTKVQSERSGQLDCAVTPIIKSIAHLRLALAVRPACDWYRAALCTPRLHRWRLPYMPGSYAEFVASTWK